MTTATFADRLAELLADPTFEPELLAESQTHRLNSRGGLGSCELTLLTRVHRKCRFPPIGG